MRSGSLSQSEVPPSRAIRAGEKNVSLGKEILAHMARHLGQLIRLLFPKYILSPSGPGIL